MNAELPEIGQHYLGMNAINQKKPALSKEELITFLDNPGNYKGGSEIYTLHNEPYVIEVKVTGITYKMLPEQTYRKILENNENIDLEHFAWPDQSAQDLRKVCIITLQAGFLHYSVLLEHFKQFYLSLNEMDL